MLRVLANLLGLDGFEYETSESIRDEITLGASDLSPQLNNHANVSPQFTPQKMNGLERVADVPIYFADALARRAPSLQKTADAKIPTARMTAALMQKLGVENGASVRVSQGDGSAIMTAALDACLPENVVRIAAAHPATSALGSMLGSISVEKA